MCVYPQEITSARIVVKNRKEAYAMEEEILSGGKKLTTSLHRSSESSLSRQTVGLGALIP